MNLFARTLLVPVAVITTGVVVAQPSSPGTRHVCSVTTASGAKQLLFSIVKDKGEARQVAARQSLGGAGGKVVLVHECIDPTKEKFIDAKAAELLANTPR